MTSIDAIFFGLRWEFLNPWTEIRDYLQLTEIVIADATEKERRVLEAATNDMTEERRDEYLADEAGALQILEREIPQFHRRGTYVTLISEWEKEYREVATDVLRVENQRRGTAEGFALRLDDFNGDVYEQSRKVVTRFAGVGDDEKSWGVLRQAVRIRNVLVHRAGRVVMDEGKVADAKLAGALAEFKRHGLSLDNYGTVVIERSCLEYLLATIEGYMVAVIKACEKKYGGRPVAV